MGQMNYAQLLQDSGGGFELLPDGTYDFVIDTARHTMASTNKVMYVTKMKVLTGPYAGKTFWNNFVVSPENPNALGFFFQHMAALGIPNSFFAANPTEDQVVQQLVGKMGTCQLGHAVVKGDTRNQVSSIQPYAGGTAPQVQAPMAAAPAQVGVPQAMPVPQQAPAPQYAAPQAPAPQQMPQPVAAPLPPQPVAPMPQPAPAPAPVAAPPMPVAPAAAPAPDPLATMPQPQPMPVPPLPGAPIGQPPAAAPPMPAAPIAPPVQDGTAVPPQVPV